MNPRTGSVKEVGERWIARVTWIDPVTGKIGVRKKSCATKSEALAARKTMLEALRNTADGTADMSARTFEDLAQHFLTHYAIAPRYEGGRKVAGLPSYQDVRRYVETSRAVFGRRRPDNGRDAAPRGRSLRRPDSADPQAPGHAHDSTLLPEGCRTDAESSRSSVRAFWEGRSWTEFASRAVAKPQHGTRLSPLGRECFRF